MIFFSLAALSYNEVKRQLKTLFPFFIIAAILLLWPLIEKANPFGSNPWPSGAILYYNDSGYDKTLKKAISVWERAELPVYFKETKDRDLADLVIFDDPELLKTKCQHCLGRATIGYGWAKEHFVYLLPSHPKYEKEVVNFHMLSTVIHELGHVLGLDHQTGPCSVMNSKSFCREVADVKVRASGSSSLCGPWQSDVKELADIYQSPVPRSWPVGCYDKKATILYYFRDYKQTLKDIAYRKKGLVEKNNP